LTRLPEAAVDTLVWAQFNAGAATPEKRRQGRRQVGVWFRDKQGCTMTNSKLQAALDELERLSDTVRGFNERDAIPLNSDSDAGRALFALKIFTSELNKLDLGSLLKLKMIEA
jgi:hypothetical protein